MYAYIARIIRWSLQRPAHTDHGPLPVSSPRSSKGCMVTKSLMGLIMILIRSWSTSDTIMPPVPGQSNKDRGVLSLIPAAKLRLMCGRAYSRDHYVRLGAKIPRESRNTTIRLPTLIDHIITLASDPAVDVSKMRKGCHL